eukprot:Nk52_evm20s262 gene=Nk52_evmTU20s262
MVPGIAVVTGASRGIGLATAKLLHGHYGYRVAMVARNRGGGLEKGREEVIGARENSGNKDGEGDGEDVVCYSCDVASKEDMDAIFRDIPGRLGGRGVNLLVNCAGVNQDALLARYREEDISSLLRTNLVGPIVSTQSALRSLLAAARGGEGVSVVNVSSVVGAAMGNAGQTVYGASKGGVVGFTRCLAREYARKGIRANVVAPGWIETAMTSGTMAGGGREGGGEDHSKVPLGRMGLVEEVAEAIAFLHHAQYVTGHVLVVDGGLTA